MGNLIIVRMCGGLGNQLFQYAAAKSLALKNNDTLLVDDSAFKGNNCDLNRNFDISDFNVDLLIADNDTTNKIRFKYGLLSKIYLKIKKKILNEYFIDWHPEIMALKGDVYLDGYFQSEKYFHLYKNDILKLFILNNHLVKNLNNITNSIDYSKPVVSLHVRRGDYVSNLKTSNLHNICGEFYFRSALLKMQKMIGNFKLFIFSDDIKWVKSTMKLAEDAVYVSEMLGGNGKALRPSEELYLMSKMNHHIISNSTFSWWGAYLNSNSEKIVIAPAIWNRSNNINHSNITPDNWLRLPVES